jgi:hypothetical protein
MQSTSYQITYCNNISYDNSVRAFETYERMGGLMEEVRMLEEECRRSVNSNISPVVLSNVGKWHS